ncbi:MAG TPA: hypothetical protein VD862_00280 [Candidatus Paceibacterota bacterium]|nr:hypothetical protein [Candidatus Paceibacterota bacterium]
MAAFIIRSQVFRGPDAQIRDDTDVTLELPPFAYLEATGRVGMLTVRKVTSSADRTVIAFLYDTAETASGTTFHAEVGGSGFLGSHTEIAGSGGTAPWTPEASFAPDGTYLLLYDSSDLLGDGINVYRIIRI